MLLHVVNSSIDPNGQVAKENFSRSPMPPHYQEYPPVHTTARWDANERAAVDYERSNFTIADRIP
jgi:hypothetical protein